jgi:hypothetical protein
MVADANGIVAFISQGRGEDAHPAGPVRQYSSVRAPTDGSTM